MKFKTTNVYFECEATGRTGIFRTSLRFYIEESNNKLSYIDRLNFYQNLETVAESSQYEYLNESIEIMHLNKLSTFNIGITSYNRIGEKFEFAIKLLIIILREWLESFSFCKIIKEIQSYINFRLNDNRGYNSEYELASELTAAKYIVNTAFELLTEEERLLIESKQL